MQLEAAAYSPPSVPLPVVVGVVVVAFPQQHMCEEGKGAPAPLADPPLQQQEQQEDGLVPPLPLPGGVAGPLRPPALPPLAHPLPWLAAALALLSSRVASLLLPGRYQQAMEVEQEQDLRVIAHLQAVVGAVVGVVAVVAPLLVKTAAAAVVAAAGTRASPLASSKATPPHPLPWDMSALPTTQRGIGGS